MALGAESTGVLEIFDEVLGTLNLIIEDLILLKQQLLIEKDHVLTDIMFQVLESGVK